MIGVIGMLVVNNVVSLHVHILSDGEIIERTYPFDKLSDSKLFKSYHY